MFKEVEFFRELKHLAKHLNLTTKDVREIPYMYRLISYNCLRPNDLSNIFEMDISKIKSILTTGFLETYINLREKYNQLEREHQKAVRNKQLRIAKQLFEKSENSHTESATNELVKEWREIGKLIAETGGTVGHGIKPRMKKFNKELRMLSQDETIAYLDKIANDPDIIRQTATYRKAVISEILREFEPPPKYKGTGLSPIRQDMRQDESFQDAANTAFGIQSPYWPSSRYAHDRTNERLKRQAIKRQGLK